MVVVTGYGGVSPTLGTRLTGGAVALRATIEGAEWSVGGLQDTAVVRWAAGAHARAVEALVRGKRAALLVPKVHTWVLGAPEADELQSQVQLPLPLNRTRRQRRAHIQTRQEAGEHPLPKTHEGTS